MHKGCRDDDNIITVSLYLRRDVPLYQNHRELVCVCLPGCPTSHMSTCLHMSAHAALQQHVQAMAADMPALMSSQGRGQHGAPAGGGTTHPPPFTHCLTSDQTWEPCLTMIGMELNRILEDKGSRLAYLSMKIFRTIIPVSVTCLFL